MNLDLFTQALLAGLMVTAVTAPLGCFVVWRRLSYFGDAVAHSSLLGVMMGVLWQVNLNYAILPVTVIFALLLSFLQGQTRFLQRHAAGHSGASCPGGGNCHPVAQPGYSA